MSNTTASPYTISNQMVSDILVTALEGGSNYWITKATIIGEWPETPSSASASGDGLYLSDVLGLGSSITIEVDGEEPVILTLDKMTAGIRKAAELRGLTPERFYDEHDSEYADCALQLAVFGKVVYG